MLKVGDKAPEFKGVDQNNIEVNLSDFYDRWVVLYFYPKDDTPGCTKEACGFRDNYEELKKVAVVLGVSADDTQSHKKFASKHELPFRLLADEEMEIINDYEAYGEKNLYGKKYKGIKRISYLINPQGKLAKIYKRVNAPKHAEQVSQDIKSFRNTAIW